MSVKPILFNTDMVRAILDGRKTATRRLVKPQPTGNYFTGDKAIGQFFWGESQGGISESARPPYQLGDILYVRETFVKADDGYHYRADATPDSERIRDDYGYKYRPSIHMPKEAARIWLKITDVGVERLLRMSHEAARQEGIHYCESPDGFTWKAEADVNCCYVTPSGAFEALWNSTVNKANIDRYGWESNSWAWVIEFERCEKPKEAQI